MLGGQPGRRVRLGGAERIRGKRGDLARWPQAGAGEPGSAGTPSHPGLALRPVRAWLCLCSSQEDGKPTE